MEFRNDEEVRSFSKESKNEQNEVRKIPSSELSIGQKTESILNELCYFGNEIFSNLIKIKLSLLTKHVSDEGVLQI